MHFLSEFYRGFNLDSDTCIVIGGTDEMQRRDTKNNIRIILSVSPLVGLDNTLSDAILKICCLNMGDIASSFWERHIHNLISEREGWIQN